MSKFIKVKCPCGNEQTIFASPASAPKCAVCKAILAAPTGSKAKLSEGVTFVKAL